MKSRHFVLPPVPSSRTGFRWNYCAAFIIAAFSFYSPSIAAQNLYAVDSLKVLADSKAGKSMAEKLEKLAEERTKIIRPTAEALEAEKKSLEAQVAILAPEEMQKNTKLQDRINSFQTRYRDFEIRQRRLSRELDLTRNNAINKFNEAMLPVIESVAKSMKSKLILEKRSLLFADDSIDITKKVILRLDRTKTTIEVKWIEYKEQQPASPSRSPR